MGPGCLTWKEGLGISMPGRVNCGPESRSHYLLRHQVTCHGRSPGGEAELLGAEQGSRSIRFTTRKMTGSSVE